MSLVFDEGKKCIISKLNNTPIEVAMNMKGANNTARVMKKSMPADLTFANAMKNGINVISIIQEDWITVSSIFTANIL